MKKHNAFSSCCCSKTAWLTTLGAFGVGLLASGEEAPAAPLQTALSSTVLSGYVDVSAIWNVGTGNAVIPGRWFDGGAGNAPGSKLDGFNLDLIKLSLEKPVEDEGWAAGYRVDLMMGPDAIGYNPSVGALPNEMGLQQAYAALKVPVGNGILFKAGVFNTLLGYEVVDNCANPNFSRSFGWQIEPTQHTGLLASYQVNDALSVSAGVANVHAAGINARSPRAESSKAYTGAMTLTAPESVECCPGASLTVAAMKGFSGNANRDTTSLYAGGSMPTPWERLTVGAAFDYRWDAANALAPVSNWTWAAGGYLLVQATEKLKVNTRVDYTRGSDGIWFDDGVVGVADGANELGSLTVTGDYALWANVLSRLELRWDHCFTGGRPYGIADKNATTVAANLVYKF